MVFLVGGYESAHFERKAPASCCIQCKPAASAARANVPDARAPLYYTQMDPWNLWADSPSKILIERFWDIVILILCDVLDNLSGCCLGIYGCALFHSFLVDAPHSASIHAGVGAHACTIIGFQSRTALVSPKS